MNRPSAERADIVLRDTTGWSRADVAPVLERGIAELLVPTFGADLVDTAENLLPQYADERAADVADGLLVYAEDPAVSRLAGLLLAEVFDARSGWIITYVVVAPEMRGHGLGRRLIDHASAVVRQRLHDQEALLFAETEKGDGPFVRDRFTFLARAGFRRLDFAYVQPALAPGKMPVTDLLLLCRTSSPSVDADRIAAFLRRFYASIAGPRWSSDAMLSRVVHDLEQRSMIPTLSLD
jgi:GNAT superfamily N-acetyltransferase